MQGRGYPDWTEIWDNGRRNKDQKVRLVKHKESKADLSRGGASIPHLTIAQVAAILQVSEDYVRKLITRGHLDGVKMPAGRNGPIRIPRCSLEKFLQEHALSREITVKRIPRNPRHRKVYRGVF